MRLLASTLAAAVLTPLLPAPALAADPLTWSVSPSGPRGPDGRASLEYKLDPGATVSDHVAVTNHSRQPLTLALYAGDAHTTAGGGFGLLAGATAPADAGSWITLAQPKVTLPASTRVVVPFTVRVPANATPGDHAAGVVAALTGGDGTGRVTVEHRVGTRVHLRVTGPLRPRLAITGVTLSATRPWNPFTLPGVTADFTIRNEGNVRLSGSPAVSTDGLFGWGAREAGAAAFPEILPGGEVRTSVRLADVPPLFRERLTLAVRPAPADGRAIDPAPVPVVAHHGIWLVPWPQLAVLALLALALLGWRLRHRRRDRRMAAALAAAEQRGRDAAAQDRKEPS